MLVVDVIGGLTQDLGTDNGAVECGEKLLASLDEYSSLSTRVYFNPWNANWKQIAYNRHLIRRRYYRDPYMHLVCPYSYGVGHGTVRFAEALDQYGLKIDMVVCSDGIYRHWWMKWRSLYGNHAIHFPDNIVAYRGFHQEKTRPCGKKPTGKAICMGWDLLEVMHIEMDDHPAWHDACIEEALKMAGLCCKKNRVPKGAPETPATVIREES